MVKEKRIIGINAKLFLRDRESLEEIGINSKRSLLDFDIVLINGSNINEPYLNNSYIFEYKPLLNYL